MERFGILLAFTAGVLLAKISLTPFERHDSSRTQASKFELILWCFEVIIDVFCCNRRQSRLSTASLHFVDLFCVYPPREYFLRSEVRIRIRTKRCHAVSTENFYGYFSPCFHGQFSLCISYDFLCIRTSMFHVYCLFVLITFASNCYFSHVNFLNFQRGGFRSFFSAFI